MVDCVKCFTEIHDSLLYMTIQSQADTKFLQRDLKKLEYWEEKWGMEFNTDKCHVLWVTRKKNPIIHDYMLYGKVVETVDSAKYMRVIQTLRPHVESH